jgi:mono/diheme cytochrome c family protein
MQDQPRYEAYESSNFFKDGLSARPYPTGTVPRGYLRADAQFYTGKITKAGGSNVPGGQTTAGRQNQGGRMATGANTQTSADTNMQTNASAQNASAQNVSAQFPDDVTVFPFPVTREVVERGQERYQIFCAMCHGATGYGDGMIVRRGFRRPPSYHDDRLRSAPVGHFFDVITNGWGAMPKYAAQIPVQDRWAIIAYIRALQLSQQGVASGSIPQPNQTQAGGQR